MKKLLYIVAAITYGAAAEQQMQITPSLEEDNFNEWRNKNYAFSKFFKLYNKEIEKIKSSFPEGEQLNCKRMRIDIVREISFYINNKKYSNDNISQMESLIEENDKYKKFKKHTFELAERKFLMCLDFFEFCQKNPAASINEYSFLENFYNNLE
ncbi:hypothetical protein FACS1894113_4760 [Alphaproteobacteria bacterium]|nr:hypothetical protein FACS1894113_4760 [Alphaproteobacteria bacterium]